MSFMRARASSSPATAWIPITGPKLSSRISSMRWSTPARTVGSNQEPGPSLRRPPMRTRAPFARASSTWASSTSSCAGRVTGPMKVASSVGSPTTKDRTHFTNVSTKASWIRSWT